MIILTLPKPSATSISKYKTDQLRSVSLLAPRHPSAQLKVAVQCPLFCPITVVYDILFGLYHTPDNSDCQYH